jgi:phosphoribosylanthranilate isomerase
MTKVKVCGIRRTEDAALAVRYGADALGFLVGQRHNSPDPDEIVRIAKQIRCNTIQLHGDTSPDQAKAIKQLLPYIKTYKSIHVTGTESVAYAQVYQGSVDGILLDTINVATDQVGGTGITHDWSISKTIVESLTLPVILAGGLSGENVAEAIKRVMPFGVDANSGTKGNDGYKDAQKLQSFIENGHNPHN